MSHDAAPIEDVPIACVPNALTAVQRQRWLELGRQLYPAVREIQELPGGYALRLPNDPQMLLLVAEDISLEQHCCPFLRFVVEVEPNSGPLWMRLTGREGAKEFLRLALEATG